MATQPTPPNEQTEVAWRGFAPGNWKKRVDVREFIQKNYTPYEGDGSFLEGPTERTTGMWKTLQPLLAKEREKGILDVSQVPSGILAHGPGYIDKDNEIIVGLQTDAPLKRAIMPFGGWRVVAASLESYGYKPDERVGEIFTKYRKTHNDGVFDAYTADIRAARSSGHRHRPARRLRPRPHHRRLSPGRALRRRLPDRRQGSARRRSSTTATRPRT